MALTVSGSNYNGDVLDIIYLVFDTDNEVAEKGLAVIETGVRKKKSLPKMATTENPFAEYTADAPSSDTVTTTYSERALEPQPMVMFESFLPEDWDDVWKEYQPDGDFTNAMLNPEVLNAMLALQLNSAGRQVAKLFYQGDTSLATSSPLHFFDGLVGQVKLRWRFRIAVAVGTCPDRL